MDSATNTVGTINKKEFSILSLEQLAKTLEEFKPDIIGMDYSFFNIIRSNFVPNNTIFMSNDLADKLGLKKEKIHGKEENQKEEENHQEKSN